MLDENENDSTPTTESPDQTVAPVKKAAKRAPRKAAARTTKKAAAAAEAAEVPAGSPAEPAADEALEPAPAGDEPVAPAKKTAKKAAAKKTTAKKATTRKAAVKKTAAPVQPEPAADTPEEEDDPFAVLALNPQDPETLPDAGITLEAATETDTGSDLGSDTAVDTEAAPVVEKPAARRTRKTAEKKATAPLFQAPDPVAAPSRRRRAAAPAADTADSATADAAADRAADLASGEAAASGTATTEAASEAGDDTAAGTRTGTRRRRRSTSAAGTGSVDSTDTDTDTSTAPGTGPDTATDTDAASETGADTDTDNDGTDNDTGDSDDEQGGNRRRRRRGGRRRRKSGGGDGGSADDSADNDGSDDADDSDDSSDSAGSGQGGQQRGGRGGRGRGNGSGNGGNNGNGNGNGNGQRGSQADADIDDEDSQGEGTGSRRRRRRRRSGEDGDGGSDDPQNTVTRVRKPRTAEDEITSLHGSTRLEAKKQRRREGREAGRRRAPIVSEAEFLARREAVDRVMVIRQRKDLTQIAVLEDKVLVEHYVARESQTSLIGNVYLGRVQNVLPSMEAAFIDIGKGRNAVLYAGEVNWSALGAGNGPRKIEQVLKSGQPILVQVSKDPIGHKGARLTSQISLPGRFLVYVPDGTTSGISRKLPDTERTRLKTLLKEIVPDSAGVIVRTAAEGASEEELTLDVERLTARWADIESKVAKGNAPALLYGEPDLTLKVVRDLFTEDFGKLVVSGDEAWDMVDTYVEHVAPDLADRLERYDGDEDVFAAYRIEEQIAKGLDRKVWLPSGGSLIIDRTEAMTVVDVNTGKFTGSGGNLEETVTKNNLEAAEEMVRQLRLRDIGGIIVVDFIDMVLESNRDLVLRRLVECLGRDRTRHQVAEVTSLGLVQMTRKRIGTGLVEAFSENCEHCQGRGVVIHHEPVEARKKPEEEPRRGGRRGRGRGDGEDQQGNGQAGNGAPKASPSPRDIAAMAKHEHKPVDETATEPAPSEPSAPAAAEAPATDAPATEAPATEAPAAQAQAPATEAPAPDSEAPAVPAATESAPTEPAATEQVAPATEQATEPSTEQTEQAEQAPAEPEAPVVPQGPRIVTSTRRRVARRPAGSAAPSSASTVSPVTTVPATAPQPSAQSSAGSSAGTEPVEAPAPRLVTSSRRKVARRPAGPPVSGPGSPADGEAAGEASADGVEGDSSSPHVPVKNKGARRH